MNIQPVSLGTWTFAGGAQWGETRDKESIATVHAALACGVNLFDTAPAYGKGRSEQVLGTALMGRRDQAYIATKVAPGDLGPEKLKTSVDDSLARLRTDYIDLLQVHWPGRPSSYPEMIPVLEGLIRQGKVRHFGVCNHGEMDLTGLLDTLSAFHQDGAGPITLIGNQLPYSLLTRAIEFGITDLCRRKRIGILAYSPLAHGALGGKYHHADDIPEGRKRSRLFHHRHGGSHGETGCEAQLNAALRGIGQICRDTGLPMSVLALAWVVRREPVRSVLCGARTSRQMEQNVLAARTHLPPDVMERLDRATLPLKRRLGPNPDLWKSGKNSRFH
uniref:Predicted oxidoreductase n=1 Tax=Candidatus Kentrum sp. FW TaxID=2126338 RepID=A0A450TP18_9GAMM|nr:MAG: Predicted oxidoreductase [Candidatus Kentron sp. FW]